MLHTHSRRPGGVELLAVWGMQVWAERAALQDVRCCLQGGGWSLSCLQGLQHVQHVCVACMASGDGRLSACWCLMAACVKATEMLASSLVRASCKTLQVLLCLLSAWAWGADFELPAEGCCKDG